MTILGLSMARLEEMLFGISLFIVLEDAEGELVCLGLGAGLEAIALLSAARFPDLG